jgi:hypothetical protein
MLFNEFNRVPNYKQFDIEVIHPDGSVGCVVDIEGSKAANDLYKERQSFIKRVKNILQANASYDQALKKSFDLVNFEYKFK